MYFQLQQIYAAETVGKNACITRMKLQITVQTLEWKKINRGRGRGYGTFRGIEEIASRFSRG